jgi:hypothetical protein
MKLIGSSAMRFGGLKLKHVAEQPCDVMLAAIEIAVLAAPASQALGNSLRKLGLLGDDDDLSAQRLAPTK